MNIWLSFQSESPSRKKRKTVGQTLSGASSGGSDTVRASRPRSLRRRTAAAAAAMQAQHMPQSIVAPPHQQVHDREHGTVRGRRRYGVHFNQSS